MLKTPALALFLALAVGCASKNESTNNGAADTGAPEEDTAPAEDTAPWNSYPEGPYGLEKDNVFPNAKFMGYREGVNGTKEWTELAMQDYYDPTGERGVYAILVVVSAEWCGPCKEEAKDLPGFYTNLYKPRGARFLSAMIENSKGAPADQAVVDRWMNTYKANYDIGADPDGQVMLTKGDPNWSIPRNYIINPRDMRIARVNRGVNPDATNIPGLKVMLDYNGAPAAPTAADAGASD
jgi:hypothetical protein